MPLRTRSTPKQHTTRRSPSRLPQRSSVACVAGVFRPPSPHSPGEAGSTSTRPFHPKRHMAPNNYKVVRREPRVHPSNRWRITANFVRCKCAGAVRTSKAPHDSRDSPDVGRARLGEVSTRSASLATGEGSLALLSYSAPRWAGSPAMTRDPRGHPRTHRPAGRPQTAWRTRRPADRSRPRRLPLAQRRRTLHQPGLSNDAASLCAPTNLPSTTKPHSRTPRSSSRSNLDPSDTAERADSEIRRQ